MAAGDPRMAPELLDALHARDDVFWVCHDPREFKYYRHWDYLGAATPRVIVIRETLEGYFHQATFIPHPYNPVNRSGFRSGRSMWAISTARSASPKRTQWILQANDMLSPRRRVHLFGEPERWWWYNHCKPRGIERWKGHEPGSGVRLAGSAQFSVDCTVYRGDGGGTQYTWLEAMDGGAMPVCSTEWASHPGPFNSGDIEHGQVAGPDDLVTLLRGHPPEPARIRRNFAYLVANHTVSVADAYATAMGVPRRKLKPLVRR
jgi:hypothetical protein